MMITVDLSVQWRRGGGDEGQGLRGDRDRQALRYSSANCVHQLSQSVPNGPHTLRRAAWPRH